MNVNDIPFPPGGIRELKRFRYGVKVCFCDDVDSARSVHWEVCVSGGVLQVTVCM